MLPQVASLLTFSSLICKMGRDNNSIYLIRLYQEEMREICKLLSTCLTHIGPQLCKSSTLKDLSSDQRTLHAYSPDPLP